MMEWPTIGAVSAATTSSMTRDTLLAVTVRWAWARLKQRHRAEPAHCSAPLVAATHQSVAPVERGRQCPGEVGLGEIEVEVVDRSGDVLVLRHPAAPSVDLRTPRRTSSGVRQGRDGCAS